MHYHLDFTALVEFPLSAISYYPNIKKHTYL